MEVDTGVSVSVISESTFGRLWPDKMLNLVEDIKLSTYTGESIKVAGQVLVDAEIQGKAVDKPLPLLVVEGSGPSLLGQDWLQHVRLDWLSITKIHAKVTSEVESLISEFPAVFADGLVTYTGPPARLVVPETAQPTFCKARSVPYAFKDKVCEELRRLESE